MTEQVAGAAASPLEQTRILANGTTARMKMPNMWEFANGSFDIPNAAQNDIYQLIYGGDFSVNPVAQLNFDRQRLRGMYALAAIVFVEPRVVLDTDDAVDGAIFIDSLVWGDVLAAWSFFRFGPPRPLPAPASQEPGVGAGAGQPAAPAE